MLISEVLFEDQMDILNDLEELITRAKAHGKFKIPTKIFIVEDIPKGPTGKLQRIGLAKKFGLE